MRASYRNALIGLVALAAVAATFVLEPIAQDPRYHDFADRRALAGVPHIWNVATNLPFLAVGLAGIALRRRLASRALSPQYLVFCLGVALVALGSGWYHLAPSTPSLVWDRLPMTVAFMALTSAVIADRVSGRVGRALLGPLVVAGLASIAWWVHTEAAGRGDLRPYALVQFLPMLVIPVMLVTARGDGLASGRLWAALGAYAAAKVAEHSDGAIFGATAGVIGGHAIKHLLAALAAWWILRAFQMSPARAL